METAEESGPCNNRPPDAPSNAPAATKPTTAVKPKLSKGVENAKKRLRAFSIQKKTSLAPIILPKPASTGHTTVLIGKLCGVKPSTPKVDDEQKKLPKPPKPGSNRRPLTDSYIDLQKKTLAEIEDMKRKMELVELGIPLGLICPTSTSEKAMPTKAMPPIKHFLGSRFRVYNANDYKGNVKRNKKKTHAAKVDEIIKEAKKARDEGKKYKFDYQKLLPEYDNPFQRKKEEEKSNVEVREKDFPKEKKKNERFDSRRHYDYKRDERDRYKYKDKEKGKERSKDRVFEEKETNVNLNDYLICDSWSLDNEDKTSSPRLEEKSTKNTVKHNITDNKYAKAITEQVRDSVLKKQDKLKEYTRDSPIRPIKIEKLQKLQPVIDSFKFEIDPNDDEVMDIFDVESESDARKSKDLSIYSPTDLQSEDYDQDTKDTILEDGNEDTFLESIINEIKQEDMSDDMSQDKGLVEYDSPIKEETVRDDTRLSITPELDDRMKYQQSQRSDYSDGYRSSESGYKTSDTTESGYKSMDSFRLSIDKELEESMEAKMSKSTVESLETWSFVLKICQPILFRHDKNKCYRETRTEPKVWYTENPKLCNCVKDRGVVYEELHMCKMNLVDRVYGCDQIPDAPASKCRNWYPRPHLCLTETHTIPVSNEWEGDDISQTDVCAQDTDRRRSNTPLRTEEILLDREYQRFMKAVWPEVESRNETPRSTTPVKEDVRKKKKDVEVEKEIEVKKKKEESSVKKMKVISSEGWSQESDIEEEIEKSKKIKIDKEKLRKRKRSLSSISSESEPDAKKTKKMLKKKALKKTKSKSAKKRRIGKKILKKLKEKEKKKKNKIERIDDSEDEDSDRKNIKKTKKKKLQKQKNLKRKKKEETSSSSSTTDSSTDESDKKDKKKAESKKKKDKKRKRKTSSDSQSEEELFDVNILNNIKTERLTDDEKAKTLMDFSPRRHQKPREIINVKELQNDFVGNNIHIKKEIIEDYPLSPKVIESQNVKEKEKERPNEEKESIEDVPKVTEVIEEDKEQVEVKEPQLEETSSPITIPQISPTNSIKNIPMPQTVSNIEVIPTISPIPRNIKPVLDDMSLCSSQESICSVKMYEKDDSHLRPSSQNSNYNFNDVINASQSGLYCKQIETVVECDNHVYQQDNYEMYEHLAMAYQSDVASQQASPPSVCGEQRIETVVRARSRGEIKCDWRPGLPAPAPAPASNRPSRWGLKPVEVNIVLTGGSESTQIEEQQQQNIQPQQRTTPLPSPQPVYKIQSLANRTDTASGMTNGYDEAYMDMYGASDRLQYGDCFSEEQLGEQLGDQLGEQLGARLSTLDARIDHALKNTVLGEVAKEDPPPDPDKDAPEKGILVVSSVVSGASEAGRGGKRVSFADGYKPGQDSDVEEPPVKKRRKARRVGCAWPCPAAHADHVPLWDALPPPPPPPGSPPPRPRPAPPLHLLRRAPRAPAALPALPLPPALRKLENTATLPLFIPSEPPPALVRFP